MKAFARHRNQKADGARADAGRPADDETPDPASGDDFIERLGDLDQFIGAGTTAPVITNTPAITRLPSVATARNVAPPPDPANVDGATRRLFDANDETPTAAPAESEADEFLERLGDLDRFITPQAEAPVAPPAPAVPPADASGDDFIERLGDLDRFISPDHRDPS